MVATTTSVNQVLTHGNIAPFVSAGWINAQRHPELPLTIYNYSHKTQFARHWTPETMACRGLILADDGRVIARPFPKFFNLSEHDGPLPDEPHRVYDKLDGSLFIVAVYSDDETTAELVTATRGSFTGIQAEAGRAILAERDTWFRAGMTYLFEVIYPENRIVVDYGDRRDLVLLAAIDNETGRTIDISLPGFASTKEHPLTLSEIESRPQEPNAEGYVVHFIGDSDLRIKIKHDEYVRLHRLLTGVNARSVWEWLSEGRDIDAQLGAVPDEFYGWVRDTVNALRDEYDRVLGVCTADYWKRPNTIDRRELAEYFKTCAYPFVLFAMLDGRDAEPMIWKIVKPAADRPFKQDES